MYPKDYNNLKNLYKKQKKVTFSLYYDDDYSQVNNILIEFYDLTFMSIILYNTFFLIFFSIS